MEKGVATNTRSKLVIHNEYGHNFIVKRFKCRLQFNTEAI